MINRRGFLQAASAALSVVGIKLPQAKGFTAADAERIIRARDGEVITFPRPPDDCEGTLIPLHTDGRALPAMAVANFHKCTRIYFDLPCDCRANKINFSCDDGRASMMALARDQKGQKIVEMAVAHYGEWWAPIGHEIILRKGRFWMTSDRFGEHGMAMAVFPLTWPPSPA